MTGPLYLVRHGQTDWNREGRLQGQADTDINARGREQAERNGGVLAAAVGDPSGLDFVASPMRRTRETMERVRRAMGLPAQGYRTDMRLVEVHFGDWQGHTLAELDAAQPGSSAARERDKWRFRPPGERAESYEMLAARVRPWFEALSGPTVCVTHGGVLRVALMLAGHMAGGDAARLDIPNDRVLRLGGAAPEWL